jgi:hypothetical protein
MRPNPPTPVNHETRLAFSEWLSNFDTRIVELGYGARGVTMALSVVTIYNGKSTAPFLQTALLNLSEATTMWWTVLMLIGLFQVAALVVGTARKTFLLRAIASFLAGMVWAGITLAMVVSPQPLIVTSQYILGMLFNTFTGFVLLTQHDEARETDSLNQAEQVRHGKGKGAHAANLN